MVGLPVNLSPWQATAELAADRRAPYTAAERGGRRMGGLGLYVAYLVVAVLLVGIGLTVYSLITPYNELRLIREGNAAAAYSLSGTAIGFALAVASAAAHSVGLLDLVIWGVVALVSQLVVFFAVSALLPGFRKGIETDKASYGLTLGGVSIAMGILNAGSLTT